MNLIDASHLGTPVARKILHKKGTWNPGGEKGKLHRRLGIPEDQPIPAERLAEAARSKDPETRREAIRARTMKKWRHTGSEKRSAMYGKAG